MELNLNVLIPGGPPNSSLAEKMQATTPWSHPEALSYQCERDKSEGGTGSRDRDIAMGTDGYGWTITRIWKTGVVITSNYSVITAL